MPLTITILFYYYYFNEETNLVSNLRPHVPVLFSVVTVGGTRLRYLSPFWLRYKPSLLTNIEWMFLFFLLHL